MNVASRLGNPQIEEYPKRVEIAPWLHDGWVRSFQNAQREALDIPQKKEAVHFLFETGFWDKSKLTFDSAISRFNANLDPDKPAARFTSSETFALCHQFDRPQLLYAWAEDLNHEQPRRIPTAERQLQLVQRLLDTLERTEAESVRIRAELERLAPDIARQRFTMMPAGGGF